MTGKQKTKQSLSAPVFHQSDKFVFREPDLLHKQLHRSLKAIRRHYEQVAKNGIHSEYDEWVYDNYYMVERACKQVIKQISGFFLPCRESGAYPEIYLFIKALVFDLDCDLTTQNLILRLDEFEQVRSIKNAEIEFIPKALTIAAIELIAQSMEQNFAEGAQRAVTTIGGMDNIVVSQIHKEKNRLQKIYTQDSSYEQMDETTQNIYKYKTERIAVVKNQDEAKLAKQYVKQAQKETTHIGQYIYADYRRYADRSGWRRAYLPLLYLLPLILGFAVCILVRNLVLLPLCYFLLVEVLRPILEYAVLYHVNSEYPPRLALHSSIPEEYRTLVTISMLMPGIKDLPELKKKLERLMLTNDQGAIGYCILVDLKQADFPVIAEDRVLIRAVKRVIDKLNKDYDGKFIMLVRGRSYSKTQDKYTGYERKRGAIGSLCRLLCGEQVEFEEIYGNRRLLQNVSYLLALDYDTKILLDSVPELVGIAAHPLNRPVVDKKKNIVTQGYGILSPRIVVDLKSSFKTSFSKIMGGIGGISSYEQKSANLYQDIYQESIFCGKGLIDVKAFREVMEGHMPEETVLSHDILEGSMMRTLYVGDVEFVDDFPDKATPYFKRMHRWIRGDFQNILFLFSSISHGGEKHPNMLNDISRYKLFDNLRRALLPVVCMLGFLLCIFLPEPAGVILFLVSLFALISPYLFSLVYFVFSGNLFDFARKYYSEALPQAFLVFTQMLYSIVLLPKTALVCIDAAIRSIYRLFISHKNLLQWQTASQAAEHHGGWKDTVRFYGVAELFGLFFLLSPRGYLRLLGIFFLAVIPLVLLSQKPHKRKKVAVKPVMQEKLISDLMVMYGYFTDFANAPDHYLPPDNIMLAPKVKTAHRTSPTNIGLMLISVLTARDFELIDSQTLCTRIEQTVSTLETLEKFHGNLYNWYDTRTLKILSPSYISTVDSGNLLCSLVALKEGLKEYLSEEAKIGELIPRIEQLIAQTDLSVLYNPNKNLFSIGYDKQNEILSSSHYDMLMSEARMTSYFAVAKRQVPKKHWGALARTLARQGLYTGPVSWTGTMFEYFMPELMLHNIEGSLGNEGLKFCIHCQKKRAHLSGTPFGISESCYYAFDTDFNYQYKAHGAQKIALKRGMEEELVISPYSSYLILPFCFESSYRNLQRMERMGAYGKYGMYEAIDFTKDRIGESPYVIIKSYMAHHIGMSIVALNNALNGNIMQKRFLRDRDMMKAKELLQEKIAVGDILFEDITVRKNGAKKAAQDDSGEQFSDPNPISPRVKVLSNGEITSVMTDVGTNHVSYQGQDLTRRTTDILTVPKGVFAFWECGGKVYPVTFAPCYEEGMEYHIAFDNDSVTYTATCKEFELGQMVMQHQNLAVEQRQFVIKNKTAHAKKGRLLLLAEPVLARHLDDSNHPAFSKLFVSIRRDRPSGIFVAKRKTRGKEPGICMGAGLLEPLSYEYETKRENIMERNARFRLKQDVFTRKFEQGDGTPDPIIVLRLPLSVDASSQKSVTLLTSAAGGETEAINQILSVKKEGMITARNSAKTSWGMNTIENRLAQNILPQLLYQKKDAAANLKAIKNNILTPDRLWSVGISGDVPIVLVEVMGDKDVERVRAYLNTYLMLRMSGIEFDLVFTSKNNGEYRNTAEDMLHDMIRLNHAENLISRVNGIHLVDAEKLEQPLLTLLRASACHIASKSMVKIESPAFPYRPFSMKRVEGQKLPLSKGYAVNGGTFLNESFFITGKPKVPWCHILANPTFGTLLSDSSLGFTFAVNARENKITPWSNDVITDNTGELLLLHYQDTYYNLLDGAVAEFHPSYAKYYGQIGEITYDVTIQVPVKGMFKDISICLHAPDKQEVTAEFAYYLEPCLNVTRDHARQIKCVRMQDGVSLWNPFNRNVPAHLGIRISGEFRVICDRAAFLCGRWDKDILTPVSNLCTGLVCPVTVKAGDCAEITARMAFAVSEKGVAEQLKLKGEFQYRTPNHITVDTPDQSLNFLVNTWLPLQTVSSRIYARTGFYQCGGAYGFRDQLQDVCSYMLLDPQIARVHIIRCCASQFEEGDAMHWWHILGGFGGGKKGVRTRYSDDMLWLPYVLSEYISRTGDQSILEVPVKYLKAGKLEEGAKDAYLQAEYTDYKEDVYTHAKKAIQRGYNLGQHGLPKIGCGDWNDGYNKVGIEGEGESVWLAQFLAIVLKKFSHLCTIKGEESMCAEYLNRAESLLRAVDEYCYDGAYYIRAFYDNGQKMGSSENDECKIDLLPQSFSGLSGMPDKARIDSALNSAYNSLVDQKHAIIKLFTPAFHESAQDPGYVKAYPKGVRENGGQYTHAAVWYALSLLEHGDIVRGNEIINLLNPIRKYEDSTMQEAYLLEPYYMAADIYTNENAFGRGGWSLYTGTAGWYYTVILEALLGIRFYDKKITLLPRIPADWSGYKAQLLYSGFSITIEVKNTHKKPVEKEYEYPINQNPVHIVIEL